MAVIRTVGLIGIDAYLKVVQQRAWAVTKHGPLKPGTQRWKRLLGDEFNEAYRELVQLQRFGGDPTAAIIELAQVAQLCIGIIELLQQGKVEDDGN